MPSRFRVEDGYIGLDKLRTDRFALVVHVLFDGWCFPNLVVVFGTIKVCTPMQRMLDHEVVVLEFKILWYGSISTIVENIRMF